MRRIALTLLSYVLRLTHRATPSASTPAVTDGHFGARAEARWGSEHRTVTRAAGMWFATVVQQLEAVPEVRRGLRLCANNALRVRGERLVLPWQPREVEETGTAVREVSVRHTAAVRAAIQLAHTPVPYRDIVCELSADHPDLGTHGAEELLDVLIARRMLLTSLQPSGTETDTLGYVAGELDRVGAMDSGPAADLALALREIHAQMRDLDGHNPVSEKADRQRTAIVTRMRRIADEPTPLAVDTRVDAELVLPRAVAWEAETAMRRPGPGHPGAARDPSVAPLPGALPQPLRGGHVGRADGPARPALRPRPARGLPRHRAGPRARHPAPRPAPDDARPARLGSGRGARPRRGPHPPAHRRANTHDCTGRRRRTWS